jgi:prepilin-type N-terminal cleavage/methylation domain-containing protein
MKKFLKKKGFTLIELIVVITILGILVAIAVPSILNYITTAQNQVNAANERTAKSQVGLDIALGVTGDDGAASTVVDGVTFACTWTSGDFPTAFDCDQD